MAQSTIKSINPKYDESGDQRTWSAQGKKFYDLVVIFADGTSGDCSSLKPGGNYKEGDMVLYTATDNSKCTNGKKIRIEKKVDSDGGGKSYNDPLTVNKIALSICQTIAVKHYLLAKVNPSTKEEINTLAEWYNNWVISNISSTNPSYRDTISRRYYALQLAVECLQFPTLGIAKKDQVVEMAETFLIPINNIDNDSGSTI